MEVARRSASLRRGESSSLPLLRASARTDPRVPTIARLSASESSSRGALAGADAAAAAVTAAPAGAWVASGVCSTVRNSFLTGVDGRGVRIGRIVDEARRTGRLGTSGCERSRKCAGSGRMNTGVRKRSAPGWNTRGRTTRLNSMPKVSAVATKPPSKRPATDRRRQDCMNAMDLGNSRSMQAPRSHAAVFLCARTLQSCQKRQ
jgi:hypothetical protein